MNPLLQALTQLNARLKNALLALWRFLRQPIDMGYLWRAWILPLLGLATLGGMIFGFWQLSAKNPAAIPPPAPTDESISLRFDNVELHGRKQGTPFFTIYADRVEVTRDQRYVKFLKGKNKPHGEFYNLKDWEPDIDPRKGPSSLTRAVRWEAENAEYDYQTQSLKMQKNVEIVTDAGDVIKTDEMVWSRNDETLSSSTRSTIDSHDKNHLESDKLKVETRQKNIYLEGRVFIDMDLGENVGIDVEKSR